MFASKRYLWALSALIICLVTFAAPARALEPNEVLVVANRFVSGSLKLARYYMEQRSIPADNLLKITTSEKETVSRRIYDREIARPIRKYLQRQGNRERIRALVTMRGVPLKVAAPELSRTEQEQLMQLRQRDQELREQLRQLSDAPSSESKPLQQELQALNKRIDQVKKKNYSAAVDSELALVMSPDLKLEFWQTNPFFVGFQKQQLDLTKDDVLLVSRLDGPSFELVQRMIDDSLRAERTGLRGTAYFDARVPRTNKTALRGYALYEQSLHLAAERIQQQKVLPVVVEETGKLFQPGDATAAALYCGWYSLARYVDAFDWVPGAVAYHIASQECQTLRGSSGRYWCKSMLEEGAAAVIGPVAEPYVQAFPLPEAFFSFLVDGYYTLAEAYFLSLPYLSWRMVLVGDPLYRPFRQK
jgi:uncharacterized protein (TIGR03790 family)